jgi:hypothetical protein
MFEGVMMYRLHGKHAKTNNQSESMCILSFVTWKYEGYNDFHVRIHLTEHDK